MSLLSSHNIASLPGNKLASLAFSIPTSLSLSVRLAQRWSSHGQYETPRCSNSTTANISRVKMPIQPISLSEMCGRVIWCVLYSQLEEGALLQWFEWFCPLCLTVAKALGCRIKSLMIAHHLGKRKMHFLEFQTDFIQKDWPGYDTEWSLWWPACVFQMGSHTHNIYCRFCWQYRHFRKDVVILHWLHHHQATLLQWRWFRELWIAQELTEYFKLVASHFSC